MIEQHNYKLTRKQIVQLLKLDWEEDWEKTLKLIHNFGNKSLLVYDLPWFMEKLVPHEAAKLNISLDQKYPEDKKADRADFDKVVKPKIGKSYHLAWAHKGCVWVLKEILDNGKCKLMTPKTKKILIGNVADLLNVRNGWPN